MNHRTVFAIIGLVSMTVSSLGLAGAGAPPYGAILAGAKRARHNEGTGNGRCDYSDAQNHGGWGWNAATGGSCPPANDQGYCDFSHADSNDGWGWNPVTNQSCR